MSCFLTSSWRSASSRLSSFSAATFCSGRRAMASSVPLSSITVRIANTKGEGEKSAEDFWVKAERLLYCALVGYIWYEAPAEEMNFITLLELINASEAREDDEEYQSPVDLLFADLEERDPDHFAVKQYRKYKLAAGDICSK